MTIGFYLRNFEEFDCFYDRINASNVHKQENDQSPVFYVARSAPVIDDTFGDDDMILATGDEKGGATSESEDEYVLI